MHANRIIPGGGIPDAAGVRSPRPASHSARRAATFPEPPGRFGKAEPADRAGSGQSDSRLRVDASILGANISAGLWQPIIAVSGRHTRSEAFGSDGCPRGERFSRLLGSYPDCLSASAAGPPTGVWQFTQAELSRLPYR